MSFWKAGLAAAAESRQAEVGREGVQVGQGIGIVIGIDDGDGLARAVGVDAAEGEPIAGHAGGIGPQAVGPADLVGSEAERARRAAGIGRVEKLDLTFGLGLPIGRQDGSDGEQGATFQRLEAQGTEGPRGGKGGVSAPTPADRS